MFPVPVRSSLPFRPFGHRDSALIAGDQTATRGRHLRAANRELSLRLKIAERIVVVSERERELYFDK